MQIFQEIVFKMKSDSVEESNFVTVVMKYGTKKISFASKDNIYEILQVIAMALNLSDVHFF